jgi:hypothetical protein
MSIIWNTGAAAMRFRLKKNKKKNKAASSQAREDIIHEENERLLDRGFKRVGPPNKESGFKRSSLTGRKQ